MTLALLTKPSRLESCLGHTAGFAVFEAGPAITELRGRFAWSAGLVCYTRHELETHGALPSASERSCLALSPLYESRHRFYDADTR
jgi:hypothetical protein